ncbi:MAG: hypothetical protein Q9217_001045 [Psora testacea]
MKLAINKYAILLVAINGIATLGKPAGSRKNTLSTDIAPHSANRAPVINPYYTDDAGEVAAAVGATKCISFTSDDPSWRYTNSAPWSGSGTFGTSTQICVPYSDSAGGAMYIGSEAEPGPGSTKLECFFPSAGTANCDISLVDGYSLSVQCDIPNYHTIGGSTDLWKTGQPCIDKNEIGRGICKNDQGYAANEMDVTPFFQAGINNGNFYCIWVNCAQDYYFPVNADIHCHVSGSIGY